MEKLEGSVTRVEVCKWRDSVALRIPATALRDAGLRVGQILELRVEGGCLVLEPAVESLDALLARVTPENRYGPGLEGSFVGAEAW